MQRRQIKAAAKGIIAQLLKIRWYDSRHTEYLKQKIEGTEWEITVWADGRTAGEIMEGTQLNIQITHCRVYWQGIGHNYTYTGIAWEYLTRMTQPYLIQE